ncbi:hypothetical protein A2524_02600 [Candidatus Wolfebacteria bacterium RIFOXYD12_FULL_48_21]|uniref:Uncharacterized protein n=1 Tax=Candidatus Wolfebacteria bacterium RIFOXYD1_FULL_48_65 TaxID=1802561 RepID=A0A1F8DZ59_9BACT|nr:MAG: hypothetical protein A2610_01265 [Candidatus Wolfebacteria bacterium RIFOXYD1_FULL_48_65]OGM94757.1 MAG: hypothetical protein A2524_02600 [Candidatus Wolfebacteria bacterium RIFOXYD12_FULL_48_21]
MNKKNYAIIAIILVAIVAGFIWWSGRQMDQLPETIAPADTTDAIQAELDGIDIGELDAEFADVDEVIKGL